MGGVRKGKDWAMEEAVSAQDQAERRAGIWGRFIWSDYEEALTIFSC